MQTTTNPQLGLLDSLMPSAPANDFLETLDTALDWKPIERALQAMYPATTGRPPCAPLVLFKMSLLQHCYGLSDPQCEELVGDRLSWRRFVGLGLQDAVPDETTLVNFRKRLREHGQHENLLPLVNRQLQAKGLILKTCTLVDATLLQAARRAPAREDKTGGDGDAGYGVTAAKLTALQANIDGFKAIVSKPRDNIVAGATVTQELSDEFDAADETLSEILDGLVGQFQATNAKFVSDYNNARTIVDTSASHASPNQPTPAPTPATTKPAAPAGLTAKP